MAQPLPRASIPPSSPSRVARAPPPIGPGAVPPTPSDGITPVVTLQVDGEGAVTILRHFNDAVRSTLLYV